MSEWTDVEQPVMEAAENIGWKHRKVTSPGRRGAFDRVFIKDGRHVWMEFKFRNGKPSKLQIIERYDLLAHGAEAYFVKTKEEGIRILSSSESHKPLLSL